MTILPLLTALVTMLGSFRKEDISLTLQTHIATFIPTLETHMLSIGERVPKGPLIEVWTQTVNGRQYAIQQRCDEKGAESVCFIVYETFAGDITLAKVRLGPVGSFRSDCSTI